MVNPRANGCPDAEVLAAYVDQGLSLSERARVEAHLAYDVPNHDSMRITYAWSDAVADDHTASHTFAPSRIGASVNGSDELQTWSIPTAKAVVTRWVEMQPVP